jgi:molybdate transport system ATP-binding protein
MSLQVQVRFTRGFRIDAEFVADRGVTVLFGASGAGKTTVLDSIAGLSTPVEGRVVLGGKVLLDVSQGVNVRTERRGIGYVPQTLALFPHMTAAENVAFGMLKAVSSFKVRASKAGEWLERVGVAHRAHAKPHELSGGERQRVAIARALATGPRLLLLDEPFSALDDTTKFRLLDDFKQLLAEAAVPVLFVTHDVVEAVTLGMRAIEMSDGRVVRSGDAEEVLGARREELLRRLSKDRVNSK